MYSQTILSVNTLSKFGFKSKHRIIHQLPRAFDAILRISKINCIVQCTRVFLNNLSI